MCIRDRICTLAKHAAELNGCEDALMLDYRGFIAETTSANIFLVINNEIHTPKADCFLNGITRQEVIKIAAEQGIKLVERHIKLEELAMANEVFCTGTAARPTQGLGRRLSRSNGSTRFRTGGGVVCHCSIPARGMAGTLYGGRMRDLLRRMVASQPAGVAHVRTTEHRSEQPLLGPPARNIYPP